MVGKKRVRRPLAEYSEAALADIATRARAIVGSHAQVSHITPRAYCVAKPAPFHAVFVTPPEDLAPIVADRHGAWVVQNETAAGVSAGDWCQLAYVYVSGCGTPIVVRGSVMRGGGRIDKCPRVLQQRRSAV